MFYGDNAGETAAKQGVVAGEKNDGTVRDTADVPSPIDIISQYGTRPLPEVWRFFLKMKTPVLIH
jgi:hypothetical protein